MKGNCRTCKNFIEYSKWGKNWCFGIGLPIREDWIDQEKDCDYEEPK